MSGLLIIALTVSAPATSESAWAEFAGFSNDERVAAYRHDVHQSREDGTVDQYSLIQTVDVRSGYPVATFRASAIHRLDAKTGRPLKIKKSELLSDNPKFANAYPNKRWTKLEKRQGFKVRALDMAQGTLELTADKDVQGSGEGNKDKVMLVAAPSSPLGFSAVAKNDAGKQVRIGRFRQDGAQGKSIAAQVMAYTSRSGEAIAVVALFLVNENGQARGVPAVQVKHLGGKIAVAGPAAAAPVAAAKPAKRAEPKRRRNIPRPRLRIEEPEVAVDADAQAQAEAVAAEQEAMAKAKAMDPWHMRASMSSGGNVIAAYKKREGVKTTDADKKEIAQMQRTYNEFVGKR